MNISVCVRHLSTTLPVSLIAVDSGIYINEMRDSSIWILFIVIRTRKWDKKKNSWYR